MYAVFFVRAHLNIGQCGEMCEQALIRLAVLVDVGFENDDNVARFSIPVTT